MSAEDDMHRRPPWHPATGARALDASPLRMPVQPQVAPPPVGSGISFRELPQDVFEQVRLTCDFYEAKVSGQYHNHPASARYLKGLSDDIRALLGPLQAQHEQAQRLVRTTKRIMEEWERSFGEGSGFVYPEDITGVGVTPAALRHLIDSQHTEIERLRNELSELQQRAGDEMHRFQEQVDAFADAARAAAAEERERSAETIASLTLRHEGVVVALQADFAEHMRQSDAAARAQVTREREQAEAAREQHRSLMENMRKALAQCEAALKQEKELRAQETRDLHTRLRQAQAQIDQLTAAAVRAMEQPTAAAEGLRGVWPTAGVQAPGVAPAPGREVPEAPILPSAIPLTFESAEEELQYLRRRVRDLEAVTATMRLALAGAPGLDRDAELAGRTVDLRAEVARRAATGEEGRPLGPPPGPTRPRGPPTVPSDRLPDSFFTDSTIALSNRGGASVLFERILRGHGRCAQDSDAVARLLDERKAGDAEQAAA